MDCRSAGGAVGRHRQQRLSLPVPVAIAGGRHRARAGPCHPCNHPGLGRRAILVLAGRGLFRHLRRQRSQHQRPHLRRRAGPRAAGCREHAARRSAVRRRTEVEAGRPPLALRHPGARQPRPGAGADRRRPGGRRNLLARRYRARSHRAGASRNRPSGGPNGCGHRRGAFGPGGRRGVRDVTRPPSSARRGTGLPRRQACVPREARRHHARRCKGHTGRLEGQRPRSPDRPRAALGAVLPDHPQRHPPGSVGPDPGRQPQRAVERRARCQLPEAMARRRRPVRRADRPQVMPRPRSRLLVARFAASACRQSRRVEHIQQARARALLLAMRRAARVSLCGHRTSRASDEGGARRSHCLRTGPLRLSPGRVDRRQSGRVVRNGERHARHLLPRDAGAPSERAADHADRRCGTPRWRLRG